MSCSSRVYNIQVLNMAGQCIGSLLNNEVLKIFTPRDGMFFKNYLTGRLNAKN
jgi:hypothetical protein